MDVCFSNYRAFLGESYGYSYHLPWLAAYYRNYRRLMNFWKETDGGQLVEVSYRDLVTDTRSTCRTLLQACGLPFEESCLDNTSNPTGVSTLSSAQVRERIHTRSINEWHRYADKLAGFEEMLCAS